MGDLVALALIVTGFGLCWLYAAALDRIAPSGPVKP